jgi:hypothetical protein
LSLSLAQVRTTSLHRRKRPAGLDLSAADTFAAHAALGTGVVFVASKFSLGAACAPTGSSRHASSFIAVSGIGFFQVEGFITDEIRMWTEVEPRLCVKA